MERKIEGKKIAILLTDGFEHSELVSPMTEIREAGGTPIIVSLKKDEIKSWKENQ